VKIQNLFSDGTAHLLANAVRLGDGRQTAFLEKDEVERVWSAVLNVEVL